jgi:hypothetical protein
MTAMDPHSADIWGVEGAQLPESLDGWRVLEIGAGPGEQAYAARGAAETVICDEPSESLQAEPGQFDLIHCSVAVATELHPLAVGAWLWRLGAPDCTLVYGGVALADPELTAMAKLERESGNAERRWRWLPGRMALRWMVENSGFDVDRWIGERPGTEGQVQLYLQARRVDRLPGLDLNRQPLGR